MPSMLPPAPHSLTTWLSLTPKAFNTRTPLPTQPLQKPWLLVKCARQRLGTPIFLLPPSLSLFVSVCLSFSFSLTKHKHLEHAFCRHTLESLMRKAQACSMGPCLDPGRWKGCAEAIGPVSSTRGSGFRIVRFRVEE